jgi:hypothetical protein
MCGQKRLPHSQFFYRDLVPGRVETHEKHDFSDSSIPFILYGAPALLKTEAFGMGWL